MTDLNSEQSTYVAARRCLSTWLARSPRIYRRLFENGSVPCSQLGGDCSALVDLDLVQVIDRGLVAKRCVYPLGGMFLVCDRPTDGNPARVFPIFHDESVLLASWIDVHPDDVVLDLGTGSGVIAFSALKQGAKRVIASDINNRVKECFELNRQLNGFADRIEYVQSDTFGEFDQQRFDLIAVNPPFVPVPPTARYFLHSDGGPHGTAMIERILGEARRHLSERGRLLMLALSLGGSDGWRLSNLLARSLMECTLRIETWVLPVYKGGPVELEAFTDNFSHSPDHTDWVCSLQGLGYDQLDYFALHLGFGSYYSRNRLLNLLRSSYRSKTPFWKNYVGDMKHRLRRYSILPREVPA